MCGRFCIAASPGEIFERFGVTVPAEYKPGYNLSPGKKIPAITRTTRSLEISLPEWGFHTGMTHPVINARIETIQENFLFRDLFPAHRCLIPASGYYEWKQEGDRKFPWYFSSQSDGLISFAGLIRPATEGDQVVILTTRAVPPYSEIHDRMPVILNLPDEQKFLADGEITMIQQTVQMYQVSTRVNAVSEEGPDLIKPWKPHSVQKTFGDIACAD